jgi:hypothetical protein
MEDPMLEELRFLERDTTTPCEAYTALWKVRLHDARQWAFAMRMVGFIAAIALIAALVLFAIGQNGAGIASGVGTVVSGVGFRTLWARRNQTQKEAEEFLSRAKEFCSEDRQRALGLQ